MESLNLESYPVFLPMPIDRDYEAKYVHNLIKAGLKSRPLQQRIYEFLEHPGGFAGCLYHIVV